MIYFHIPFCKQACHYCDFHFSTSLKYKEEMLLAMHKELEIRASYLNNKTVESIYFGGGTPSILEADEIQKLIDKVGTLFEISSNAEITLEANPDDLNVKKVKEIRGTSINRFSIGIQSFFQEDLTWMNRAHNAQEADGSIKRVQDAGFENITCDLIYGYPLLTDEKWQSNINKLVEMDIPHISSYNMTVESKTALAHFVKQGISKPMSDAQGEEQMLMLIDTLTSKGFEHYEISNFAKNGLFAKHNTNYWKGKHYLGIGPSAHSFNGNSRSWNIANNANYIKGIFNNIPNLEEEILSQEDRYNEYVMTSLRTMWGIDLTILEKTFGYDYAQHFEKEIAIYTSTNQVERTTNNIFRLTAKGKLMADHIASELFVIK